MTANVNSSLRVASVQIFNVLGVEERAFELGPGGVEIRGRNGEGKSSILAAIQAALGGGVNLGRLARVDREGNPVGEPKIILELRGPGAETYRVERTADKARVLARVGDSAAFEDVGAPASWLKSLFDVAGCNPVKFLTEDDKRRCIMLLEALPLTLDGDELAAILGRHAEHVPHLPAGLHPLEEIEHVHLAVYNARTGVNRDAKAKRGGAEETRRNTPAAPPEDPSERLATLRAEVDKAIADGSAARAEVKAAETRAIDQADAAHDRASAEVRNAFGRASARMKAEHEAKAAEIRREAERQVAAAAAAMAAEIEKVRDGLDGRLRQIDEAHEHAIIAAARTRTEADIALTEHARTVSERQVEVARLDEQSKVAASVRGLIAQAERFDAQAVELEAESQSMTDCLAALDAFRRRLADNIPIEGLAIKDKRITLGGVPWAQLNTATQVRVAVQVAMLRTQGSRLPLVVVDGIECLDSDRFAALSAELTRHEVQALVGGVANHPLTVEPIGAPAPAGVAR